MQRGRLSLTLPSDEVLDFVGRAVFLSDSEQRAAEMRQAATVAHRFHRIVEGGSEEDQRRRWWESTVEWQGRLAATECADVLEVLGEGGMTAAAVIGALSAQRRAFQDGWEERTIGPSIAGSFYAGFVIAHALRDRHEDKVPEHPATRGHKRRRGS